MRSKTFLVWLFAAYGCALLAVAVYFRHALNVDAVAYLRIAHYYATGNMSLALSGYWSPLASWVMAPLLALGLPPLVVARGFMAGSALVFLWGCLAVFRALQLPPKWTLTGAVLAALAGVYWSVQFITPDLLVSGIIGLAFNRVRAAQAGKSALLFAIAGLLWGLAYLAKAVAFPLTILFLLAMGLAQARKTSFAMALRSFGLVILGFAVLAGPWVLTLSIKYGRPTFSTTTTITHSLTGPPDIPRYHPFGRTLHHPEPGRITSWEEPSRMAYANWSPFESTAYAIHQVRVVVKNLGTCVALVTSLNLFWLVLPVAGALYAVRHRRLPDWARPLLVPALLVFIYLPCFVTITEQRFFYPALPFLFSSLALWATSNAPREKTAWWLTLAGGLAPILAAVVVIGARPKIAGECAADIAQRLEHAGIAGPVVGSAMLPGGRTGLYVAYLLNQQWYGDAPELTPSQIEGSGARLVMVHRGSELDVRLAASESFTNLAPKIFPDGATAERCPVAVYERRL